MGRGELPLAGHVAACEVVGVIHDRETTRGEVVIRVRPAVNAGYRRRHARPYPARIRRRRETGRSSRQGPPSMRLRSCNRSLAGTRGRAERRQPDAWGHFSARSVALRRVRARRRADERPQCAASAWRLRRHILRRLRTPPPRWTVRRVPRRSRPERIGEQRSTCDTSYFTVDQMQVRRSTKHR